jgi:uncharacterized phage protein (TIGR01671 family)
MNREIKFRGWDGSQMYHIDIYQYINLNEHKQDELLPWGTRDYPLQQFTGLLDKNGVEIYEGDIIIYTDPSGCDSFIAQVIFNTDMTLSSLEFGLWNKNGYQRLDLGEYEVIGNIYENPELLKEQSDE